jgi:hypothetical protein
MKPDRQLAGISFAMADQRRRKNQPLNGKEFSAASATPYSAVRKLFREPGFPLINGRVYWSDFVLWRHRRFGLDPLRHGQADGRSGVRTATPGTFPPQARRILEDMR